MSITTTKDVFCDICPRWVHGGIECTAKYARQTARQAGWKRKKIDGQLKDVCPTCQDLFK